MPAAGGDRWRVAATEVKVAGQWRSGDRAIDQFGQVIDVFVSADETLTPPTGASSRPSPPQGFDQSRSPPIGPRSPRRCWRPAAWHGSDQDANSGVECDHRRLKARLGPMRGRNQDRRAGVVIAGQALVQNLRCGHDELAVEAPATRRLAVAFGELALTI